MSEHLLGADGRRLDRLPRRHPPADESGELARQQVRRVVQAEDDAQLVRQRALERGPLRRDDPAHLGQHDRLESQLLSLLGAILERVERRDQPGAALLHQRRALLVEHGADRDHAHLLTSPREAANAIRYLLENWIVHAERKGSRLRPASIRAAPRRRTNAGHPSSPRRAGGCFASAPSGALNVRSRRESFICRLVCSSSIVSWEQLEEEEWPSKSNRCSMHFDRSAGMSVPRAIQPGYGHLPDTRIACRAITSIFCDRLQDASDPIRGPGS